MLRFLVVAGSIPRLCGGVEISGRKHRHRVITAPDVSGAEHALVRSPGQSQLDGVVYKSDKLLQRSPGQDHLDGIIWRRTPQPPATPETDNSESPQPYFSDPQRPYTIYRRDECRMDIRKPRTSSMLPEVEPSSKKLYRKGKLNPKSLHDIFPPATPPEEEKEKRRQQRREESAATALQAVARGGLARIQKQNSRRFTQFVKENKSPVSALPTEISSRAGSDSAMSMMSDAITVSEQGTETNPKSQRDSEWESNSIGKSRVPSLESSPKHKEDFHYVRTRPTNEIQVGNVVVFREDGSHYSTSHKSSRTGCWSRFDVRFGDRAVVEEVTTIGATYKVLFRGRYTLKVNADDISLAVTPENEFQWPEYQFLFKDPFAADGQESDLVSLKFKYSDIAYVHAQLKLSKELENSYLYPDARLHQIGTQAVSTWSDKERRLQEARRTDELHEWMEYIVHRSGLFKLTAQGFREWMTQKALDETHSNSFCLRNWIFRSRVVVETRPPRATRRSSGRLRSIVQSKMIEKQKEIRNKQHRKLSRVDEGTVTKTTLHEIASQLVAASRTDKDKNLLSLAPPL
eukprot:gene384-678_t